MINKNLDEYTRNNYISFIIKEKTITFSNRFCVDAYINSLHIAPGASVELANNGIHTIVIAGYTHITYFGKASFNYELITK